MICELVQQLVAKGERILLVAPTHVAVDEVLRRIGSQVGVRPLRLSWDEGRVAVDVRRFLPASILEPFLDRLSADKPSHGRTAEWERERDSLSEAITKLHELGQRQSQTRTARDRQQATAADLSQARVKLTAEEPTLINAVATLAEQVQTAETAIIELEPRHRQAEAVYHDAVSQSSWMKRLLAWSGLGELGRFDRHRRQLVKQLTAERARRDRCQDDREAAQKRWTMLRDAVRTGEQNNPQAEAELASAVQNEEAAQQACAKLRLLQERHWEPANIASMVKDLRERDVRLEQFQKMSRRFLELIAEERSKNQNLDGLRRDLLAISNLFCCTTTGVAGSTELRDLVFDTLIIDEASRVTDGEFLIGAVRARRWILVGDEHQLPPYVEQNDEHFLHALSALNQAEVTRVHLYLGSGCLEFSVREAVEVAEAEFSRTKVSAAQRLHDWLQSARQRDERKLQRGFCPACLHFPMFS